MGLDYDYALRQPRYYAVPFGEVMGEGGSSGRILGDYSAALFGDSFGYGPVGLREERLAVKSRSDDGNCFAMSPKGSHMRFAVNPDSASRNNYRAARGQFFTELARDFFAVMGWFSRTYNPHGPIIPVILPWQFSIYIKYGGSIVNFFKKRRVFRA